MARREVRAYGIAGISLSLLFAIAPGCGKEQAAAPPAAPPPAATAQSAPVAAAPTQNPGQLQIGMTPEQVQQIMGAPAQTKQEHAEIEWKYYTSQGQVEVKLLNGRVTAIERK